MKKAIVLILALGMFVMFGYGCDDNIDDLCSEPVSFVANTRESRLYYPCTINGAVGATTMSSGYTGDYGDVEWLSEAVAQAGFVVLAFTPTSEWGMVSGWRDAHKSSIAKLKDINSSHSVLKGKIDTGKLSTCGHSKGGGGSLWASSQLRGDLKTTVGMAPYREGFSDSTLGSIAAATFIQAGSSDTLATNSMTRGEFSGLGNISKKYVEYAGYDHLAWASAVGSKADRLSGDIIAWMKYYMNGDNSQKSTLADQSGTSRFEWIDLGNGGSASSGSTGGATYSFIAVHSGKAMDVWEWGTADGTNITQYGYWADEVGNDDLHAQKFYLQASDTAGYYWIVPVISTGQRLDVVDGATDSGANIQTWSANSFDAQKFRFEDAGSGAYRIINKGSQMCLTVENASMEDGANVIQEPCNDNAENQMFTMAKFN